MGLFTIMEKLGHNQLEENRVVSNCEDNNNNKLETNRIAYGLGYNQWILSWRLMGPDQDVTFSLRGLIWVNYEGEH